VKSAVAEAVEEQRASTDSFASFLDTNRSAMENVAHQVASLAKITTQTSGDAADISRQVENMTTVSRKANTSIPEIVQRAVIAADNRKAPRSDITDQVVVRSESGDTIAPLRNVSLTGARVGRQLAGDVEVTLPNGLGQVSAKTAWSNEGESGVEFKQKLQPGIMDQLLGVPATDAA
jgi:hypothetical protein